MKDAYNKAEPGESIVVTKTLAHEQKWAVLSPEERKDPANLSWITWCIKGAKDG